MSTERMEQRIRGAVAVRQPDSILAEPPGSAWQAVVGGAEYRVGQNTRGLLEALKVLRRAAFVGMVDLGKLAVLALDRG